MLTRPHRRYGLLLLALTAPAAASAQNYPARDVGPWTVAASSDKQGCFITRAYDGPGSTTLMLGLDIDGSNRLSVLNDNWSIASGEKLRLDFRLSNGGYANRAAIGITSQGKPGFVATFEPKFPAYFAGSKVIEIYRGKTPVEKLTLAGSGAAVAELRRCVDLHRARAGTGRSADIPRDPFSRDAGRKSRK